MDIAIIYSSITGNTKNIVEEIRNNLQNENMVYFGKVTESIPK